MQHSGMLSLLKGLVVRGGIRPREPVAGLWRGIKMNLDLSSQAQLYFGLWEREVGRWVLRLGKGIGSAVDVGAGQGEYTLYFLLRSTAQTVLAVEPSAAERSSLEGNLRLNGLLAEPRLRLFKGRAAAVSAAGTARLDSLVSGAASPFLVKVDVDGGEVEVLDGALELLHRADTRWVIETHAMELERECLARFAAEGYQSRIVPNAWWRALAPERRPVEQNRWLVAWKGELP